MARGQVRLLVAVLVVASACQPVAPSRTVAPDAPVRGGVAVELLEPQWEIQTLQPMFASTTESRGVSSLIYADLLEVDALTGEPRSALGSWEISGDGRTYSWRLASATWSDGMPVVAADVVTALK